MSVPLIGRVLRICATGDAAFYALQNATRKMLYVLKYQIRSAIFLVGGLQAGGHSHAALFEVRRRRFIASVQSAGAWLGGAARPFF
jgi:hypothetical protein